MSTLNSSSTLAQVQAAYMDNASYQENGSAAQANAFISACRFLMLMLPKSGGNQGATMVLSPELVQGQLADAQTWLASNPDSSAKPGGVGYFSFNNLR